MEKFPSSAPAAKTTEEQPDTIPPAMERQESEGEMWFEQARLIKASQAEVSGMLRVLQSNDPTIHACMPLEERYLKNLALVCLRQYESGKTAREIQEAVVDFMHRYAHQHLTGAA